MRKQLGMFALGLAAVLLMGVTYTNFTDIQTSGTVAVGTALTVGTTATVTGNIVANGNIVGDGATVLSGVTAGTVATSTATTAHIGTADINTALDVDAATITIDGGLTNIGGGTYTLANGDNDVGIDGDLEANGAGRIDGALTLGGNLAANGNIIGDGATQLYGYVRSVSDCAASSTSLAIAQSGMVLANNAATTVAWVLPAAAAGLEYTFSVVTSGTCEVDCNASDRIAGTNADGDRLRTTGTVGDYLTLTCRGAAGTINWAITGKGGTWADAD